jgi:hypothetical protein
MKNPINVLFLILAVSFTGFINQSIAQKSVQLKYHLESGDRFNNVSNIEQTIQFEAMGQKATLDQEMTFYMASEIDSVVDGIITQSTTFKRIVMDQKIFGMEINYDSDDSSTFNSPMGAEFAAQMNKLINATVVARMNDRGQVQEMDLSELGDAGEMSGNLNTGNNYAVYPDYKVKVGESWEEELKPLETSNMAVKVKYTLKKATRKEAVLDVDGILSANIDNPEAGGELDGTMVGEMTIDRKTGMVKVSSLQLDMEMEMEKNGMNIPATVTSFIETTIKKQ